MLEFEVEHQYVSVSFDQRLYLVVLAGSILSQIVWVTKKFLMP